MMEDLEKFSYRSKLKKIFDLVETILNQDLSEDENKRLRKIIDKSIIELKRLVNF